MAELTSPPFQVALEFFFVAKETIGSVESDGLAAILRNSKQHIVQRELDNVVRILKPHNKLLRRFQQTFLRNCVFSYWRDMEGIVHVLTEYNDTDGEKVALVDFSKEEVKATRPKGRDLLQQGIEFTEKVLDKLEEEEEEEEGEKDNRSHIKSVIFCEKKTIEDLDKAVDIIIVNADIREREKRIKLFGKIMPDYLYVSVWTRVGSGRGDRMKKIASYCEDSKRMWSFTCLEYADPDEVAGRKRYRVESAAPDMATSISHIRTDTDEKIKRRKGEAGRI